MSLGGRPPRGGQGGIDWDICEIVAADPSAGSGLARQMGWRVRLADNSLAWDKTGALDTDWTLVGTGGGGAFPGFGAGTPTTVAPTSIVGVSGQASRSDHAHAGVYGLAPPAVAAASDPGIASAASRSDHTHAGVQQVTTGDAALGVATAAAIATLTQNIIASWPLGAANRRIFLIDPSGSDANIGYVDGSASFPLSGATVAAKAKKTVAGLGAVLPRVGAGRGCEIIIRAGTYTDAIDTLLNGVSGYAATSPVVRGTDTNATAGATAFAGDTADCTYLGGVTVAGLNAAGYNPTGVPTNQVIQCLKVGGAAPALPAMPLAPVGWRMRFDSGTATAALRNICREVAVVAGGDTITALSALPAVPAGGDVFYLEQAGVVIPGGTIMGPGAGSNGTVVGVQLVGVRLSSSLTVVGMPLAFAFSGITGGLTATGQVALFVRQTYVHPLGTQTAGGGLHITTTLFCGRSGSIDVHGQVTEGIITISDLSFVNWKNGSICGGGMTVNGTVGNDNDTITSLGPAGVEGQLRCLILGSNAGAASGLLIANSKVMLGAIDITGCGARPCVLLNVSDVTQLAASGLTGNTGNLDAGVTLGLGLNRWLMNGQTNSVGGVAGDVRLASGSMVAWGALAVTGVRDTLGSMVVGGSPPLSPIIFCGKLTSSGAGAVFTFAAPGGDPTVLPANQALNMFVPQALRLFRRLRVRIISGALGVATTFTVFNDGVATAMSCTIGAGGTTGVDDAHTALFSDGDLLDVRAAAPLDGAPSTIVFTACAEYAA